MTRTVFPGEAWSTSFLRLAADVTRFPANDVMTSPAPIPALSAGVPGADALDERARHVLVPVARTTESHAEERGRPDVDGRRAAPCLDLPGDLQRPVDRNRISLAAAAVVDAARCCGVDADHPSVFEQRAARVSGPQRRRRLDQAGQREGLAVDTADRYRFPEPGDPAALRGQPLPPP